VSFPRYPKYKDSGVEWLGEVPEHWGLSRTKNLFCLMSRSPEPNDEIVTAFRDGQVTLRKNRRIEGFTNAVHEHGYQRILRGDLVIHAMDAFAGAIGVSDSDGKSTPVYSVCRAKNDQVDPCYYGRLMRHMALTGYIISLSKGIRERSTEFRWSEAGEVTVAVPPVYEQAAVVAFLDCEAKKIDGLVAEQQRLIELLTEKRQAVISHAVTKGLDPHAPMRPSGIEWLGDVPGHWGCASLTRISNRVVVGIAEAATHAYADIGIPILRSTNIRAGKIIGDILFIDPTFAGDRESKRIAAGDLVTVRTGNAGVTAVVPTGLDGCQCFTMLITSLDGDSSAEFYCYWMNSVSAQCYFSLEGWGTAQVNISVPILKALPVPIPPHSEQRAIVAFLARETAKFDALMAEAQRAIDLLQERRTALISAAVTGKIDVRGLVQTEAA
jgi:type I restriction enzyme S subunit